MDWIKHGRFVVETSLHMAVVDAELDFFQQADRRRSQGGWRRNQNFHHRTYVVASDY